MVMKATGILRRVDDLGRVVIPKEVRRTLNIDEGCQMEVFTTENSVIIRKYTPGCSNCKQIPEKLYGTANLCKDCIEELSKELARG